VFHNTSRNDNSKVELVFGFRIAWVEVLQSIDGCNSANPSQLENWSLMNRWLLHIAFKPRGETVWSIVLVLHTDLFISALQRWYS
jgi:hypothetical protein